MQHIKIKSYLDSYQVQISDTYKRREVKNEFEEHSYLYSRVNPKRRHFVQNPFNDGKGEWVEDLSLTNEAQSIKNSQSRTIRKIFDYGKSNNWEWFLTFTFNPQILNSFDYGEVGKKMSCWLTNQRKKNPDMMYLVVPEQHKSGRWHFHGLFSNIENFVMTDSGVVSDSGDNVFNINNFKLGFTFAVKCDGSAKVVSYLSKYVTKDLISATKGKKRYWISKNLSLPDVLEYDTNDFEEVLMQFDLKELYCKSVGGYLNVSYIEVPKENTSIPQTWQSLSKG